MNTITTIFDQLLSTSGGILFIMLTSLVFSFLMLKLRDNIWGPGLGIIHHNDHRVDFDRKLLDAQESNLRELNKDE